MPQDISVIGFYHTTKHPQYPEVLQYVERSVQADERVAVESPWTLERIDAEGAANANASYRFLFELCTVIRKKHAHVIPVEDDELYRISGNFRFYYMYEEPEVLDADERWHELSIKRSIRHLQLAHQHQCMKLCTGMLHAYDLRLMGYDRVMTIPDDPAEQQRYADAMKSRIAKFGADLTTDEWQQKRYPLVSDMTLG
jgi:hypothetical protein